jgi:hypothetical protein
METSGPAAANAILLDVIALHQCRQQGDLLLTVIVPAS